MSKSCLQWIALVELGVLGTPAATFPTFDPTTVHAVSLDVTDLIATGSGTGGIQANLGLSTGKHYFELTVSGGGGISTMLFGLCNASANLSTITSTNGANAVAVRGFSSAIYLNGSNTGLTAQSGNLAPGNVLGCAVDFGAGSIWFRSGTGLWFGESITAANPATGIGGQSFAAIGGGTMFPFFGSSAAGDACTANFGGSSFTGAVPSGFTSGWTATS